MPGSPDLSKTFLSAAALSAQTNARTMQYEAQLAHYASMADEARKTGALREQQFNLNQQRSDLAHEDRVRGLENQAERDRRIAEDKERDDKFRDQKFQTTLDQKQDVIDAKEGMARATSTLISEGLYQGMKGYDKRYMELTDPYMGRLPNQSFNAERKAQLDGHAKIATQKWAQFHQAEQSFKGDVMNTLYNGQFGGYDPLLAPSSTLKPEMQGAGFFHPFTPDTPTGRVLIKQPDGTERPVAAQQVTRLKSAWDALQQQKGELPETGHNPEAGVYDPWKEPAPVDESMREDTKVYTTPDGNPHRWSKPPGAVKGQWTDP
jgi:hypothetical protein